MRNYCEYHGQSVMANISPRLYFNLSRLPDDHVQCRGYQGDDINVRVEFQSGPDQRLHEAEDHHVNKYTVEVLVHCLEHSNQCLNLKTFSVALLYVRSDYQLTFNSFSNRLKVFVVSAMRKTTV